MRAKTAILRIVLPTIVFTVGCGVTDDTGDDEPFTSETASEITVAHTIGASCSTASVLGLSKQIAEEVACISPAGTLSAFRPGDGVRFGSSAVLPYLSSSAKNDLHRAANRGRIIVNSGYRTVAQQYLLYRWYREGRCGIAIAAPPGTSNHEGARAVDLANWSSRIQAMAAHHWAHDVPGDVVHFDHLTSPDIRGRDVRAFQILWNRNHPHDKIRVNGHFNSATAARLKRAPAGGFAKGPTCGAARAPVDVLSVDGPDRVPAGETVHYRVRVADHDPIEFDVTAPPFRATLESVDVPLGIDDATITVLLGGDSALTSIEDDDVGDAFDPTADEDGAIDD